MKPLMVRAALAALCAFCLSGCIDSTGPILADAEPVFGQKLRLQFYGLRKGFARDPAQANYTWNGALYAHAGGGMRDISAFSIHPFEAGDFIIQSVPANRARITEYAVMHKLAEGVYQVIAIDEADADEATRTAYCGKGDKASPAACRIETRDQLLAFARATAAQRKDDGGLVIRLPDGSERPERPARRAPPSRPR
ncbi:MAG TPA: hypothetical protein VIJ17_10070 [Pseudolabrys sp.]